MASERSTDDPKKPEDDEAIDASEIADDEAGEPSASADSDPEPTDSEDEPADSEGGADEPADSEGGADEPIDDEPIDDEPIDDEPIDDEPIDDEPIGDEPIDDEPIDDEPIDDEPIDDEPIDDELVAEAPVAAVEPRRAVRVEGPGPAAFDEADESGRLPLMLLVAALVAIVLSLIVVVQTEAWDPYRCESDETCRGLKECIEGYCRSPEVWERQQEAGAQPVSEDDGQQ